MIGLSWLRRVFVLGLALSCAGATPASDAPTSWLDANRGAIVQLWVTGKRQNGDQQHYGTGFLVQTAAGPRIVTAGHVVGPDSTWDLPRERCIYYRLAQFGSSRQYDCVVDAKVTSDPDLAQVYLDPFDAKTLRLASTLPSKDDTLYVASWRNWGGKGSRAFAREVKVLNIQSKELLLSGDFVESDSGSPVVDRQGRVVGVVIQKSDRPAGQAQGYALALAAYPPELLDVFNQAVAKVAIKTLGRTDDGGFLQEADAVIEDGCVFLGKRSARAKQNPPDMPFGIEVLNQLLSEPQRRALIDKGLVVKTPVNLRADCPKVLGGSAYYAPARSQLAPGHKFYATEILALSYLDDTFFWARGSAWPN